MASLKKCPYCAEDIQQAAIVCKHCGHALVPVTPAIDFDAPVPRSKLIPIIVLVAGFFLMLEAGSPVGVFGWIVTLVGLFLSMKVQSAIVRSGGAFILSLLLMMLAVKCG